MMQTQKRANRRSKALLVEDDRQLRTTLRQSLVVEGYDVLPAASMADAEALLTHAGADGSIDIALIDLGLPDGDGQDFLRMLRGKYQTPVIIISARQDDESKIRLLDEGADDYLAKPFSVGELLARMRLAMRKLGSGPQPATMQYTAGDIEIDLERSKVRRAGQDIHLTPTEFKLLARLVNNTGQVVTHRQLLAAVWGTEYTNHTHYLRLYMGQLRAKLEVNTADPRFLLTEPGVGYRLADPTEASAG